METYLMSSIAYCCHVFRKRLQAMSRYEPLGTKSVIARVRGYIWLAMSSWGVAWIGYIRTCCLDIVLLEKLQEALRTNGTSKETSTDVVGAEIGRAHV